MIRKILNRARLLLGISPPMAISLVTRICLLALGLLTTLVAARLYGPVASGQIGLFAALLGFTAVLSIGGCELMALKQLSGKDEERSAIFSASLVRIALGAAVVSAAVSLLAEAGFFDRLKAGLGTSLTTWLPVFIAVNALRVFLYETLRASEDAVHYNILLLISPVMLLLGLIAYPHLVAGQSFAWLIAVSETSGFAVVIGLLLANPRGLRLARISWRRLLAISRSAWPYFVSTLSITAYQLDILLVGMLVSPAELGVYVVASRLAAVIGLPLATSSIPFAPRAAQLYKTEGIEAALAFGRSQTRPIVLLSFPVAVLLMICGPWILSFLGKEFLSGLPTFALLCAGHMMLALAGQAGLLLVMSGHERVQQWTFLIAALVMAGLTFLLVPQMGILGAGVAVLTAALVRVGLATWHIQNRFGDGVSFVHLLLAWRRKRS